MSHRFPPPVDGVHAAVHGGFRWQVPARFNIADACCRRWARDTPDAPAVLCEHADGRHTAVSYARLQQHANRLSNALRRLGVQRGDRIAVALPQRFETAVAHMAVYQLGAVALPLSTLFGAEAMTLRLRHAEARLALADESSIAALLAARVGCPALEAIVGVGEAEAGADHAWSRLLAAEPREFGASPPPPTIRPCCSTPAAPPARRRAR